MDQTVGLVPHERSNGTPEIGRRRCGSAVEEEVESSKRGAIELEELNPTVGKARPERFELPTFWFPPQADSTQLSYGRRVP